MTAPPIPVLGIPHYNRPDLTLRCLRSIDHPVERLVMVLNNEVSDSFIFELDELASHMFTRLVITDHPNAGVAGAWNEIVKLFPAPWWLISNNDIEFAPGDLAKMSAAVAENPDAPLLYGNHGASFFGVTAAGIARVGLWDENIYPAYLEDCDWHHRAVLTGDGLVNVPGLAARHGDEVLDGSCTIRSDPAARAKNGRTHGGNFVYYRRKWGGENGRETFRTPFNDPHWPVWAWRFEPDTRAKQQW